MAFGILLLAIFVGPPQIGAPPDPSLITADPRPDWYLLWYFAVLALSPPSLESYIIILAPLVAGALLFSAPLISNKGERSAHRRPWAVAVVVLVVVMVGLTGGFEFRGVPWLRARTSRGYTGCT